MAGGPEGFWSYVHTDDEAEGGRVSQLGRDVVTQYEMLTGETIRLFLDRDDIKWGEAWRKVIDESLDSVAFFIPVLTPRYFLSPECRRELRYFARRAASLGVRELVMPLLYVEVQGINDEAQQDELMSLVRDFQWVDWTALRFADPTSGAYREAVSNLAARLVAANRAAEQSEVRPPAEQIATEGVDSDEAPGLLDRMAEGVEAVGPLGETIKQLGEQIQRIGELMTSSTEEMQTADRRGAGLPGRLAAIRRLSQNLDEPVERIVELGNAFSSQLHSVDSGTRAIIEAIPSSVEAQPDSVTQACELFGSIRGLAAASRASVVPLKSMIEQFAPMERMSRDLRPRLRTLKRGLAAVIEGQEVMEEWVQLIDESGFKCEDAPSRPTTA